MTTYNQRCEIRQMYLWFEKEILTRYSKNKCKSMWVDPYSTGIDFLELFTPIEMMTWQVLRGYGRAPFYPQYPIGKYFLDFGNPIVKVGIECDGKEFHTDKEKDLFRDTIIQELGWTIYRIPGADCYRDVELLGSPEEHHEDEVYSIMSKYYLETVEGLVESLGIMYFEQSAFGNPDDVTRLMCKCLAKRISIQTQEFDEKLSHVVSNYYDRFYNSENIFNALRTN